ncbi:RagB/SusD family nutrient uptake outer membrane protein [Parabacteroides gordonii]|uniref:RagB/SusD family nutrient uptake outer membrane protein n=1 Tax=Parabacteroides gordonii TaxID=574930 RepID=UPI0026EA9587|nr:RagB/SusD family nutrient uptake outer membrane protein [Parabacteroides gordonii]
MKICKYITFLGITFLLSSCTNDFLDIPSETTLSSAIYYKSQSDFEQAINGAYAPLRGMYSGNEGAWAMGELRSDNTTYKFNPNDRGTTQAEYIKDFIEQADNRVPLNKWASNYSVISRVNHLLEPIDGIEFDESAKNNIKGQAYFLRAFAYLDLVQYFGSVPLHLTPVKTLEETSLPLSSVEDVYNQIISDAQQAANLLPDKASQEGGRATSGAAKMLLGNVYINLKKWSEAEAILKEVTGYELLSDYHQVYETSNKNHKESIFEIQYKEGTEGYASFFFYTFLPQPISAEEITAITGIAESARTVEGYNIPTPDIIAAYEPGDLRKEASVGTLIANGESCPYIKKYCHAHALSGNTNDNWPVYRYAETLLFLAEAANEQNKTGEALNYLNQVRQRAGLVDCTASGQSAIREAILKERRVELAFENKRWLDLVRSGNAESVMKAYGQRVKANPQAYYFPQGYTVSLAAYTNIPLLYALPAAEAALSPYF